MEDKIEHYLLEALEYKLALLNDRIPHWEKKLVEMKNERDSILKALKRG